MSTCLEASAAELPVCAARARTRIALLTGGFDRPYAFGLTLALANYGFGVEVIGSDELDSEEFKDHPGIRFFNLYGSLVAKATIWGKFLRIVRFYARLLHYATHGAPPIFHVLWNNKLPIVDRTILMLFYRALGKKVFFTAHNVNAGERDGTDSLLNRLTLRAQYRLSDQVFVHTVRMKSEVIRQFGLREEQISVIPFGVNNSVPDTALTRSEARARLGLAPDEKAILFFGAVRAYKGLDLLADAFATLSRTDEKYRLIVAGEPKRQDREYLDSVRHKLACCPPGTVIERFAFVPDEETELYFKAADVTALPYTHIFQSGVLLLAYSFGLPVVASRVGSFEEDVREGETGFLCNSEDVPSLAGALERFFSSDLYRHSTQHRAALRRHAREAYSWASVAQITAGVYAKVSEEV